MRPIGHGRQEVDQASSTIRAPYDVMILAILRRRRDATAVNIAGVSQGCAGLEDVLESQRVLVNIAHAQRTIASCRRS